MHVDFHTHWAPCFTRRSGLDPQPWLAPLDRAGVTHAIVLPFAGLEHDGRVTQDNDEIAAVCAASGGRMIPFCTACLADGSAALTEIERCLRRGFRGIKFHPWLQGVSASAPLMDEVCELAQQYRAAVFFHDGTPPFSLPSQIALLARRHPKTQVVLGHCGLLDHWREAIAALNAAENLWGCMCGPHPEAIRQIARACDTTRLLWGSDYGFSFDDLYPFRLGMVRRLGWPEELESAIFETNPRRLLNIL